VLLDLVDLLLGLLDDLVLLGRDRHIVLGERDAGARGVLEARRLQIVQQPERVLLAAQAVAPVDDVLDALLVELVVEVRHRLGQDLVEEDPADRGLDPDVGDLLALRAGLEHGPRAREPDDDLRMQVELAHVVGQDRVLRRAEDLAFALQARAAHRDVIEPEHHVLRRRDHGIAVRRREDVLRRHHERLRLDLRLIRQRQVDGHLVAVEVGVEARADERMELDRVAFDEHRLEGLDAHSVERRGAVEHHGVVLDDLLEDVPHALVAPLQHLLGALDRVRLPQLLEPPDDERLVELEGDLLGQAALVELELGADDDDRPGRIVHALAEQVLAEPALLALDDVRKGLERPVVGAEHRAAAPGVVEERVQRLLEHALLVPDDDLGRVELEELLQPVVPVDEAPVEVVQVARCEVAAVQEDQRTEVGRDDGDDRHHHPLRLVAALDRHLHRAEPHDDVLDLLGGRRLAELDAELLGEVLEVHLLQERADRGGAHVRLEVLAVALARLADLLLGEELLLLQGALLGPDLGDDVVLVVDDAFELARLHRQQAADARRDGLEEPDVRARGGEVDVAHALAAHAGLGDLDAAAVADDAFVLDALVLSAEALPVLLGTEDALAEQAVLLRAVRPVVDGLRLLDLAVGPAPDLLRRRQLDGHRAVLIDAVVHQFHQQFPFIWSAFSPYGHNPE